MKRKLMALALALCIALCAAAMIACGDGNEGDDNPEYDIVFTGAITLNEVSYNVVLNGKDGSFTLNAGTLKSVFTGTYTFTEGKGYTMIFVDGSGTEVRTKYDSAKKEFWFIYTLDLGSARGSGNLKLTCKDDSFTQTGEAWSDIPLFVGTAKWFGGVVTANMQITCKADNSFVLFSTNFAANIPEISGTYAYTNNTYVFTVGEDTYTSTYDAETGLHSVSIPADMPGYGSNPANMTQVILTVD